MRLKAQERRKGDVIVGAIDNPGLVSGNTTLRRFRFRPPYAPFFVLRIRSYPSTTLPVKKFFRIKIIL